MRSGPVSASLRFSTLECAVTWNVPAPSIAPGYVSTQLPYHLCRSRSEQAQVLNCSVADETPHAAKPAGLQLPPPLPGWDYLQPAKSGSCVYADLWRQKGCPAQRKLKAKWERDEILPQVHQGIKEH